MSHTGNSWFKHSSCRNKETTKMKILGTITDFFSLRNCRHNGKTRWMTVLWEKIEIKWKNAQCKLSTLSQALHLNSHSFCCITFFWLLCTSPLTHTSLIQCVCWVFLLMLLHELMTEVDQTKPASVPLPRMNNSWLRWLMVPNDNSYSKLRHTQTNIKNTHNFIENSSYFFMFDA